MKQLKLFGLITLLLLLVIPGTQLHSGETNSADGIAIKYEVTGKASATTTLVFVHGWCCDRTFWEKQVPYFSKHYKVVVLDLAGHGESAMGRKKYTLRAFGLDTAAVVKKLDLKNVILVGHSMGGPIAALAAPLLPNRVTGIVGIDTFNNIEFKLPEEQWKMFLKPLRDDFKKGTQNFINMFMLTPDADPALKEKITKKMTAAPPEVGIGAMEEMFKDDIAAILDNTKVPIHCINADQFPTNKESIKRHTVSFKLKILPKTHHFLMMQKPDEFNKLLHDSVKELAAGKKG